MQTTTQNQPGDLVIVDGVTYVEQADGTREYEKPVAADPLAPCGYCRRCAIHDDPGGCLTVEAYVREQEEQMDSTTTASPMEVRETVITGGPGRPTGIRLNVSRDGRELATIVTFPLRMWRVFWPGGAIDDYRSRESALSAVARWHENR